MTYKQARSSVGERYLDVVEVGGSIPPAPTRFRLKKMIPRGLVYSLAFVFL